jgi:Tol biopolymer transport system component
VLDDAGDATLSPRALYVAATRGDELAAVDLDGHRRWTVAAPGALTNPRWSPDGFRVAYFAGERLRVVAGDGTGDRAVPGPAATPEVAPAWRPGAGHVLAFGDALRITALDVDTGRVRFAVRERIPDGPQLAFSPDGSRLLVAGTRRIQVRDGDDGRLLQRITAPRGWRFGTARWAPDGRSLVITRARGDQGDVILARLRGRDADVRRVFAADELRDALPSPDGRWILVDWTAARTWLLLPVAGGRPRAVRNPESRFGTGPVRLVGWGAGPG